MLRQVRAAVAVPLVIVLSVLGGVIVAPRTTGAGTGLLLAASTGGLLAAAVAGSVRIQSAARAVERAYDAQLRQVIEAAGALEKLVVWSAEELCRGGTPALPESLPPVVGASPADEAVALLGEVQVQAVAALMRVRDESRSSVMLSMLHQFARREHALIDRALALLDRLQDQTEDPDQLETIYKLDHLVTRLRRLAESKAVAGGQSLRSAREPVNVTQVLRGAVQEIMHYSRVTVIPGTVGVEVGFRRHVGPDLTHLLAELIENGTQFSDPASRVQVRAQKVATGLAIEVEDRVVIPMQPDDRARWNRLLADPDQFDLSALVHEQRLGLLTCALLARAYGISVELRESPTGGTTALVVVPNQLLVPMTPSVGLAPPPEAPAPPQAAPQQQPTMSAPSAAQQSAPPTPAPTAPADSSGLAAGAPALPRRVVGETPQRPARPKPPTMGPRYGVAGAFQEGIQAARAQDRPSAVMRPDFSEPAAPPSTHP
ncbi:sensor histidine kinase KdpD [Streptomyces sp. Tu102]|uniref:sensor histidine kinase n=1 Tax=Streptomyces TaxID=1883 RepID=UPI001BDBB694|nr:ATP-binding protein [Streptomyces sp. Tu102]MBT1098100.1 ATP-binding protein [Streptomyces sp. Tu102]